MEIERVHPRRLYAPGAFSLDARVPYIIKFTLEDLTDNYTVTPLDQLFKFAMERFDVSLLSVEAILHRSYENLPLSFVLRFEVYDEEKSKSVTYSRILSEGHVVFDELDKPNGKLKLDEIVNSIRECPPVGGKVRIRIKDLDLSLEDGFNYGKYMVNNALSYGDGYMYDNSERKLTIKLNLPWLAKSLPESKIEHDLKKKSPEEAAQLAKDVLTDYLDLFK